MAIENRNESFQVDGRSFCGIRRLGFDRETFVIDAWTTPPPEPRGGYFTVIPISPRDFRDRCATRAAFRRHSPSLLIVYSDHGHPTHLSAATDILDALEAECAEALPRAAPLEKPAPPRSAKEEEPRAPQVLGKEGE